MSVKLKVVVIDLDIPPRVKLLAVRIGLPIAVLVLASAIARASVPVSFVAGSPLRSADLNSDFSNLDTRLFVFELPGVVVAYAAPLASNASAPPGWLLCDGSAVSRTQYAALFAAIGTSAGQGDGATTFNVPDYRGQFLRGFDQGTGVDPDGTTRTAMQSGGNVGDLINTLESGAFASHTHGYAAATLGKGASGTGSTFPTNTLTTGTTAATGGSETRPMNATVNYLIKT